ncbi:flagellar biosynthesis regulator FlaF [Fodinicurvata sp. EGI_FJ10296]|uniref:flagellar biosynthesis regulator FlaF n=1 Tax=Fodinicurvata sp. EGI_FJ10296 TaxID=3231908 RepID=UPI003451459E
MSIAAYQTRARDSISPVEVEYQILGRLTGRLEKTRDGSASPSDRAQAIHDNRQFWQSLAIDLTEATNELPDGLKAQLISLAIWVTTYSSKVLREEKTIDALIDVNKSVMTGLSGQSSAKSEPVVHAIGAGAQA